MLCNNCHKGQVPAAGRAADNNLCCACDRKLNGPQTLEEKAPKVIRRLMVHHQIDEETAAQFLNLNEGT